MTGSATTRASAVVAAIGGLAGLASLSYTTGIRLPVILGAGAGVMLGFAMLLQTVEVRGAVTVSTVLVPVVAIAIAASFGVSLLESGLPAIVTANAGSRVLADGIRTVIAYGGVVLASLFVSLGMMGMVRPSIGEGAITRVLTSTIGTIAVLSIALAIITAPQFLAGGPVPTVDVPLVAVRRALVSPHSATMAFATFGGLIVFTALSLRRSLHVLPLDSLVARQHREELSEGIATMHTLLSWVGFLGLLFGLIAAYLAAAGIVGQGRHSFAVIESFLQVTRSSPLRGVLIGVTAITILLQVIVGLLQTLTGTVVGTIRRLVPVMSGGVLVLASTVAVHGTILQQVRTRLPAELSPVFNSFRELLTPLGVAIALAIALLVFLAVLLMAMAFAGGIGYLPRRAAGGALTAGGLVIGAITTAIGHAAAPLFVFLVIAIAIVTWDVSEYGVAMRGELGPWAGVRVESVHAVGSVAVGGVGVGLLWAVYRNLDAITLHDGTLIGTIAVLFGLVILLGLLRG